MDLEHLRTFRAVARAGSFTAAADLLHFAQSTVSVHIRSLETAVGAPLFDRLPTGARLTEAGRRLMPLSERLLDLADAAVTVGRSDGEAVGELTLAAPETVVAHRLPPILRHLRDHHPALTVQLKPIAYHEIPSAVSAGLVDVGFLLQPPLRPTSALAVKHLRTESLLLVTAAEHPLAKPVDDVAEEFARTTLFLTERGCGYRSLLESHLDRAGIRPGHTLEFDSVEAIRRCVEEGLGVALIPEMWLADPLRSGAVVAMDWFAPTFAVATQLAWHPARWQGPGVAAVIEACDACYGPSPEHFPAAPAPSDPQRARS
jgi:DNA-binding transcriptional LysR family regulator